MWTADRPQTGPEPFDHGYDMEARGLHTDPDRSNRAALFLELIGDPTGQRILDIGGGTTMLGLMDDAEFYMVVDFSETACGIVNGYSIARKTRSDVRPHTAICSDVSKFLSTNHYPPFDIACCFGLLEYLPVHVTQNLFRLAPSKVLCIATGVGEGYLKYETRITAYCHQDIKDLAETYDWTLAKWIHNPDHVQMRFEKR